MADKIIVRDLEVRNIIGVDAWERSKRQPLNINITIHTSIDASGEKDLLSESINYGTVAKVVQEFSEKTSYRSVEALAQGIAQVCVRDCKAGMVTVRVEKGKALLHARCAGVEITRSKADIDLIEHIQSVGTSVPHPPHSRLDAVGEDQIFINGLVLNTIIGVNAWEREERQRVVLDLTIHLRFDPTVLIEDHVPKMHNYRTITRIVSKYVEESNYKTVEAFALSVARLMIVTCHVPKVTVRVEKPSALVFAQGAGVEITRDRSDFGLGERDEKVQAPPATSHDAKDPVAATTAAAASEQKDASSAPVSHVAFLAFGSNLGDRARNIEEGLARLTSAGNVRVDDTSFLYETAPMYKTDQPQFLNGVVKVSTSLTPHELLAHLKQIEGAMGRDFNGERFGPRPIDLDILFYDHIELQTENLIIPHPRIKEREFVLRPLCDLAPDMEHPTLFRTNAQLLALLSHTTRDPEPGKTSTIPTSPQSSPSIYRVTPIRDTLWRWNERTLLMGILNVTPDSFSDGGQHYSVDKAVEHAVEMVAQGADIIDVGGMSTRPNADEIPLEEELRRVIPVIEALRKKGVKVPISIDTYRAEVARKAVEVGADL
ncbi:trifunctional dihydropteroate synthetase, partial [Rhizophlyctis rosea]